MIISYMVSVVSIHALAGSATKQIGVRCRPKQCFNPRTRGECDQTSLKTALFDRGFNPRTRGECDKAITPGNYTIISFNPRTRGECDASPIFATSSLECFNPRTRGECDSGRWRGQGSDFEFQSTHSRGVRHISAKIPFPFREFQSTHSRGVRRQFFVACNHRYVFQSTHSRGVRLNPGCLLR